MASSVHDIIPRYNCSGYELRWYERAHGVIAERYTSGASDGNLYDVDVSDLPVELDRSFPAAEIVRELLKRECIPKVLNGRVVWFPPENSGKVGGSWKRSIKGKE